ncbi:MAG: cell envelope integrity EipB family protein [Acetobacter sp.]|uniref:cell envelope integrity EipB family protein n=1 Tax=Acetobacter sp. TaxID=440 RepID=UPI003F93700B
MIGLPPCLSAAFKATPSFSPRSAASRGIKAGLLAAISCVLPSIAFCADTPTTAPAVQLTGQRAQYELSLAEVSGGDTLSASGTMTYTVHDTCTAWSTQQHLDIQSATRNKGTVHLVSDYTTLESKDGHHMAFRTVQKSNGATLQIVSGEASLTPNGGEVQYEKPLKKTIKLPANTLFPMAHTAAILIAAETGKTDLSPMLFDGTDEDGAQYTYISTHGWNKVGAAQAPSPLVATLPSTRVHVAFFNTTARAMLPDYEMGMRYFANGVSDKLDMDFGDFRMAGTLQSLAIPDKPHHC